jgi:hypothetical protein
VTHLPQDSSLRLRSSAGLRLIVRDASIGRHDAFQKSGMTVFETLRGKGPAVDAQFVDVICFLLPSLSAASS